jgi:hypothetical protein
VYYETTLHLEVKFSSTSAEREYHSVKASNILLEEVYWENSPLKMAENYNIQVQLINSVGRFFHFGPLTRELGKGSCKHLIAKLWNSMA